MSSLERFLALGKSTGALGAAGGRHLLDPAPHKSVRGHWCDLITHPTSLKETKGGGRGGVVYQLCPLETGCNDMLTCI